MLAVALTATALATAYINSTTRNKGRMRFDSAAQFAIQHVQYDLETYVSLLRGAQGLFAASDDVRPSEFRTYVEHLDLSERYPGVAGIGYCEWINADQKAAFTAQMQHEIASGFRVWPESNLPVSVPVLHLEPQHLRGAQVLGYDLYTDPIRRQALDTARDTGQPVASGKLRLEPETEDRPHTGFLIFVPVYRAGVNCDTPQERRAALVGFVYSPFIAEDLLGRSLERNLTVDVRFYDGAPEAANLLYDSDANQAASVARNRPPFLTSSPVEIAGHEFTVVATPGPSLAQDAVKELPALTALAGLALSVLLYSVTASLAKARAVAERTAAELYQREQRRVRRARHLALRADVSTILTSATSSIRDILQACAEAMTRQLELAFVRVWTLSLDGQVLELQASAGLYTHLHGEFSRITVGQTKIGRVAQQRVPLVIPDLEKDVTIVHPEWAQAQRLTSFAGFPLLVEGRLVGVVGMFAREAAAEDTLDTLAGLADLLAQGIERKRVEHIVLEQKRELEDFVSIVAHDLKHPVVSVQGLLGLLRQETAAQLDESGRENLEMALSECGRMKGIIAQLGHIARIGSAEIRSEPVRLRPFLSALLRRFSCLIEEHSVEATVEAPDITVLFPRVQVEEALDNLLINALQYGCAGDVRRVDVRGATELNALAISVQDHGPGIEPRFHERVFEMFRRLDPAGPVPGTGVGLAAVNRLIRRIGGTVTLDSAAGQGACFTIRFPAQVLAEEATEA